MHQDRSSNESSQVRPLVTSLIRILTFDLPLTPAMVVDFSIESDNHRRALRDAIDEACEQLEDLDAVARALDDALGDGAKLTAFVQKYAPSHEGIIFSARPLF